MSYIECCLHSLPEGSDSPSRLALAARRQGYDGIIICNHTGFENFFRADAAREIKGINVAFGTEIVASNPRTLRSKVTSARAKYPFLAVHGGSEEINKAACEDPEVDVLFHPEEGRKVLSIAAARAAQINQVAIGFDLLPLIRLRGSSRSKWLEVIQRNLSLVRKFDLAITITTGARSHLDMRAPRELRTLAEIAGFGSNEAKDALKYPGRVLEMNRRNWAAPGVEII
jgi:ribonuclease P/MRP protein subunit RPP1